MPESPEEAERPDSAGQPTASESTGSQPTGGQRQRGMRWVGGLLVAVLAFAITVQIRQDEEQDYSSLRGVELVELLKTVDAANNRLERQIEDLSETRDDLRSSKRRSSSARAQAEKRASDLAILAGTAGAQGPGIRLHISDPEGVVDAGTLLDVIEELRDAGAEAIAINDHARVIAQSAFVDVDEGVKVGTKVVKAPYTIEAIGSSATLSQAARIRGGLLDRLRANGAKPTVKTADDISITALVESSTPQYAQSDD